MLTMTARKGHMPDIWDILVKLAELVLILFVLIILGAF